jgi:hypothetical protein
MVTTNPMQMSSCVACGKEFRDQKLLCSVAIPHQNSDNAVRHFFAFNTKMTPAGDMVTKLCLYANQSMTEPPEDAFDIKMQ